MKLLMLTCALTLSLCSIDASADERGYPHDIQTTAEGFSFLLKSTAAQLGSVSEIKNSIENAMESIEENDEKHAEESHGTTRQLGPYVVKRTSQNYEDIRAIVIAAHGAKNQIHITHLVGGTYVHSVTLK